MEFRNELKELSDKAKDYVDGTEIRTVNQALIKFFYTSKTDKVFKTMADWNKEGYQIRKGSKSFRIWAKPKDVTKDEETYAFFPTVCLFSNAQVIKRRQGYDN